MAKQFFSGWELWQKLVFCLACAILVTVFLGCLKLFYTHRNLRRFIKLAEEERRDRIEHNRQTQMLQRQTIGSPFNVREYSDEKKVVFGIRAIESGVKVEGVWISPSSTPRQGSATSSAASSIREKRPRDDFDVDLEKQDLRQSRSRSVSRSTIGTARTHDRAISLDRGTSAQSSRASSPEDSPIARPTRSRHPPSSYVRYSCNPYLIRQSASLSTLEGLEAIHRASTSIHGQNGDYNTSSSDSSNESSNSGRDVEVIAASAPILFATSQPRPRSRPRHNSSTDLELLNKHRTSQAAEIGQLTPRIRREGPNNLSLDMKNLPRMSRASTSDHHLDYFNSQPTSRRPSSEDKSPENPFSPKTETASPTGRRSSMPDVTPFAQFCQKAPRPDSRPLSADSGFGVRRNSQTISVYETPPSSPIMPASDGAAALSLPPSLTLPPIKRTSFDVKSHSQVLRGHGSGFEILRPGSLNPKLPAPAVTKDYMQKTGTAPPISLHNAGRPHSRRLSSIESGRKLQKKRRSSVSPNSFDSTSSAASRKSRMSGIF